MNGKNRYPIIKEEKKRLRFISFLSGILISSIFGSVVLAIIKKNELPIGIYQQETSAVFAASGIINPSNKTAKGSVLRKNSKKELSPAEVQCILKDKGLFDSRRNPSATGFPHEFEIQNDGKIVFDPASVLTWQQSGSMDDMAYHEVMNYISGLNRDHFAGFHDWRLPTLEEAMSLMEPTETYNGLHIDMVFDTRQVRIWTSDFRRTAMAWVVWFDHGYCDYVYNDGNIKYYVRAVRSRQ